MSKKTDESIVALITRIPNGESIGVCSAEGLHKLIPTSDQKPPTPVQQQQESSKK